MERQISRITVKLNNPEANLDLVPVVLLLPMMQAGMMSNPCLPVLVEPPSGSCFDCGRHVNFKRANFSSMLNQTESATGGGPALDIDDTEFLTVYEWKDGRTETIWGAPHRTTDLSHPFVMAERMLGRDDKDK